MVSMIRQHKGAAVVAAAVVAASFPSGLFEPGAYAAAGIVIWLVVIPGLIGRILPVTSVGRNAELAGACLAVIAALATLSMAWAADQGRAFEEATRAWTYLGLFVLAAGTASGRGRREWVTGLTIGLTVVAGIALFAYLHPGTLNSGVPEIPNAAGRLSYPIGYWNAIASMLAAAGVLLAFWAARASEIRLRSIAVAVLPLVLLATWLTHSRGGILALLVGWAILAAAGGRRRRQVIAIVIGALGGLVLIGVASRMHALTGGLLNDTRNTEGDWLTLLVLVVTVVTGVVAWRADGWWPLPRIDRPTMITAGWIVACVLLFGLVIWNPVARFNEFRKPPPVHTRATVAQRASVSDVSSHGRWQFWTAALHAFESEPVHGIGAGGFEQYWGEHATFQRFVVNPHSLFLQQLAELGLLGLIPLAGFAAAVAVAAWRRLTHGRTRDPGVLLAVIVSAVVGAAVDWTWQFPVVVAPAVVCAALLTSSAGPKLLTRGGRRLAAAALVSGWIGLAAVSLLALAKLEMVRSRDAASAGNVQTSIDRARDARALEPWASEPYTQLALLAERRRDYPSALAYLKAAEARDSNDWRLFLIEARLQTQNGNRAAARMAFRRMRATNPYFAGFRPK
jgi:hypothetical protein